MKLHKIAAALAFSAMAATSYAAVAPLVTSFNAVASGGFIGGTATCAADFANGTTAGSQANCQASLTFGGANGLVPGVSPPNTPAFIAPLVNPALALLGGLPTFDSVAWGTGANGGPQSKLDVQHIATGGPVITNGGWVVIDKFQHHNNVITDAGGFMNGVAFYGALDLLADPGALGPFAGLAVPGVNQIFLDETLNALACAAPNPNNSICDDIFSTQPLEGTFQFYSDANGTPYFISFRFDNGAGGVVLDGPPLGKNIYTAEGVTSFVTTSIRIFTVPEPTMLGLFGFALVGVALSRRRKVAA